MQIINHKQGSKEWKETRLQHFTASEAPAMMNCSKYMSRNELLKLKKTGVEKPISPSLQVVFDRGHETERRARPIVEEMTGLDFFPVTGVLKGTKYLASFDGVTFDDENAFEHKQWNQVLAENVRNHVLEPYYYWQLEQQLLVSGAKSVIFVVSNGTKEKMEHMWYESNPDRRIELIAGWTQFAIDLEAYEVKAKIEDAVPTVIKSLPLVTCKVEGTTVISNIGNCLETIRERSQAEMTRELETDQDFADKDSFNKSVKKARDDLKLLAANVQNQFQSHSEFVVSLKEADSILQKMQSHGEKQVKEAKEAKKNKIVDCAITEVVDYMNSVNESIFPIELNTLMRCSLDYGLAMKGKRTIESLQNAADSVVSDFKIEADKISNKVKENLLTMQELTSEHKFLFSDTNQLVIKDNEDLIAVIKTRISDHEKAEEERLAKEREQIRIEEEEKAQKKVEDEQAELKAQEAAEEAGRIAKESAKKRESEIKMNNGSSVKFTESSEPLTGIEEDIPFVDQDESVPCEASKLGTEMCSNCGDIKRIGYICECSMDKDVPCETIKKGFVAPDFSDWWEENENRIDGICLESIAEEAFKAGYIMATLEFLNN